MARILNVEAGRHRSEVRRIVNDERLTSICKILTGKGFYAIYAIFEIWEISYNPHDMLPSREAGPEIKISNP